MKRQGPAWTRAKPAIGDPCDRGVPIRDWTRGVHFEEAAQRQLANVARLPFGTRTRGDARSALGIGATVAR